MKPTTAMKRAVKSIEPRHLRRLQQKWHDGGNAFLAEVKDRQTRDAENRRQLQTAREAAMLALHGYNPTLSDTMKVLGIDLPHFPTPQEVLGSHRLPQAGTSTLQELVLGPAQLGRDQVSLGRSHWMQELMGTSEVLSLTSHLKVLDVVGAQPELGTHVIGQIADLQKTLRDITELDWPKNSSSLARIN